MNQAAVMYRELVAAIRHDPTDDIVDVVAANLAATIGREGRTCVALDCEELPSEAERGALQLLREYSIGYTLVRRTDEDAYLMLEAFYG
jgi:hypothetical protein